MPGLFQGLELGKRALLTHQTYLQTIGHNIANVNTPGYSRQRVSISSTFPEHNAIGTIGTGVAVTDIRQVRDLFLGEQFRKENKSLGQWSYKHKIMSQIEAVFGEPNSNTLSDLLNDFWDGWDDLSTNPSSTSPRVALIENANLLTNRFHEVAAQLNTLRDAIDGNLVAMTSNINSLTADVARLNGQIKKQELGGGRANDLRDVRDQLIDELSEYIDVNTIEQKDGQVRVFIGAMEIVNGVDQVNINTRVFNDNGTITHQLVWENSNMVVGNTNGQFKGLLDARDDIVPRYLEQLDILAQELIQQVNSLHSTGYGLDGSTGVDFFDSACTGAASISLNTALAQNPDRIAASASGEEGDNTIALAIQDLRNQRVMENNTTTMSDYYNSVIGKLGVEAHGAQSLSENYELLVHQVLSARESVQGVSLDEEMTNLVKFQHAYDAAARVITTMDEALDMVILRMGVTGR